MYWSSSGAGQEEVVVKNRHRSDKRGSPWSLIGKCDILKVLKRGIVCLQYTVIIMIIITTVIIIMRI